MSSRCTAATEAPGNFLIWEIHILEPPHPALTPHSQSAGAGSPWPAKLTPPQGADAAVARLDLCERVFAAGSARLVLLRAPAGFGKTTAMQQIRERLLQSGLPVAWLSLDAGDNDVGRFLAGLIAALAPLIPSVGLLSSGGAGEGGPDELALALIERVAVHPAPFVAFFDDFEVLQNQAVVDLVAELIDQLPRGAQFVVGSRVVPELGLGRLRARGRLLEVGPGQLRFSEAEADQFLRQARGLALRSEDVRRLYRSTEGWAVALWLASVALEDREHPAEYISGFSGSNAAVVEYLVEDVLARQDDDVRSFLLRTSVLSELTAAACDTICGRDDSALMLQRLERTHLFLVPLQGAQGLYRYHGMFAEFLRNQLTRRFLQEVAPLHHAAAQWYLGQGRPVPAIRHSIAAGDLDFARGLLLEHAQALLDQGRVRLLTRWLDPLHQAGELANHPLLQVYHAWAVCFSRGARKADELLTAMERVPQPDPQVSAHLAVMRPLFLALTDQPELALPLAQSVLPALPVDMGFVPAFLEVTLANLMLILGRYDEAMRFADAARSRHSGGDSSFNYALSQAAAAAVDLVQGRLRKAIAGLRIAASAGARDDSRATNGNALAGVPLAQALYEAGQLDQAERLLSIYIPLIRHVGIPDQLIIAHVVMTRIALDRGDADRAEELLSVLEHIGHREGLSRVVACARLERVRMLLLSDRLEAASIELERCGDAALWAEVERLAFLANEVETHVVAKSRWAVRAGKAAEAIPVLREAFDSAERAHRHRRALTLQLLLGQALVRDGQHKRGMRTLARAVQSAAAEGYARALVDEGPALRVHLKELLANPELLVLERGGEHAVAFLERLLGTPQMVADGAASGAGIDPADELLTRKELQVLRLAAEGLTNEEVAERLFVAVTTVRTHLRNINVKLDARSRTEAVAAARRRGLMP